MRLVRPLAFSDKKEINGLVRERGKDCPVIGVLLVPEPFDQRDTNASFL